MFNAIKIYIQESLQELNHVAWPTRKKAVRITTIVLIFMVASAVALGIVDQLLASGYKYLLSIR